MDTKERIIKVTKAIDEGKEILFLAYSDKEGLVAISHEEGFRTYEHTRIEYEQICRYIKTANIKFCFPNKMQESWFLLLFSFFLIVKKKLSHAETDLIVKRYKEMSI